MEINVWKNKSLIMFNINKKKPKHNEETIFDFLVDILVHVVEFNGSTNLSMYDLANVYNIYQQ